MLMVLLNCNTVRIVEIREFTEIFGYCPISLLAGTMITFICAMHYDIKVIGQCVYKKAKWQYILHTFLYECGIVQYHQSLT